MANISDQIKDYQAEVVSARIQSDAGNFGAWI
jgi:hypothetical protein